MSLNKLACNCHMISTQSSEPNSTNPAEQAALGFYTDETRSCDMTMIPNTGANLHLNGWKLKEPRFWNVLDKVQTSTRLQWCDGTFRKLCKGDYLNNNDLRKNAVIVEEIWDVVRVKLYLIKAGFRRMRWLFWFTTLARRIISYI